MEVEAPPPGSVEEALHELHARFLNLPRGEAHTVERIFFQIQQAHWYYEDEWADVYAEEGLPHLRFDEFSRAMFAASPMLREFCDRHVDFKAAFKAYQVSIPKYGAVLLNAGMTHVLLVKPLGQSTFSFPKGKVNEGEEGITCAAREVVEETGYDPTPLLHESACIVQQGGGGFMKLYIAVGVPDDGSVVFAPVAKKEVAAIAWVDIASMQGEAGMVAAEDGSGYVKVKLHHRMPDLLKQLRAFIARQTNGGGEDGGAGGAGKGKAKKKAKAAAAAAAATAAARAAAEAKAAAAAAGAGSRAGAGAGAAAAGGPRPTPGAPGGSGDLMGTSLGTAGTWSVKDMFKTNSALLGLKFVYDGNPHTFGDDAVAARPVGPPAGSAGAAGAGAEEEGGAKARRRRGGRRKGPGGGGGAGGGDGSGADAGTGSGGRPRTGSSDGSSSEGEGRGGAGGGAAQPARGAARAVAGGPAARGGGGGTLSVSVREPFHLNRAAVMKAMAL
jgi:mRNA-decapping enzyme subunit 2